MSDLFGDALHARDDALAQVSFNAGDWMIHARARVAALPFGWTGTAEDIRVLLMNNGLPAPHHHNAWGALIKSCVPRFLVPTGETRNMATRRSHARRTPVYRRMENANE